MVDMLIKTVITYVVMNINPFLVMIKEIKSAIGHAINYLLDNIYICYGKKMLEFQWE